MMACHCGHAIEEHGHDPKHPGSMACTECDCIAYEEEDDEQAEPAILISFCGSSHAFLITEARTVADIMEDAMRAHPEDPEGATLPNIIMGIRHACDEAQKLALTMTNGDAMRINDDVSRD